MLLNPRIRIGIKTITIQAPRVKLLIPKTVATTPVAIAPARLIARPGRQPGSRRRHQRTTMPACERVKAANTPNA